MGNPAKSPLRHAEIFLSALAFVVLLFFASSSGAEESPGAAPTAFSFSLQADSYTSAGVYNADDELVRTLWRRVRYVAGTHSGAWDGKDDRDHPAAPGKYTIKLLRHNVSYVWDGVIGNTSGSFTGSVHTSGTSDNILDLAYDGSEYIYEALGYNEGRYDIRRFKTSAPQTPEDIVPSTVFTNFSFVATDGRRLYAAAAGELGRTPPSQDSGHYRTFVAAYTIDEAHYKTNRSFAFHAFTDASAQIVQFDEHENTKYPSCIDVGLGTIDPPAWKTTTGLAVQKNGDVLAVSHGDMMQPISAPKHLVAGEDRISLFHKLTGQPLGFIKAENPQRITFAPNGDLWFVTGATRAGRGPTLCRVLASDLQNSPADATLQPQVISLPEFGLYDPLAITVTPDASALVLIAEGGASQQVKAYHSVDGTPAWAYGQPGGYLFGDTAVTDDKFQFGEGVGLTALGDGSFWVGDGGCAHGGTNRVLHFSSARACLEQIAYLTSSLTTGVVSGDPTRVFWNFLEYKVDYSKPLDPGDPNGPGGNGSWKLVRNWLAGQDPSKFLGGPHTLVTLGNGGVYGLIHLNDGTDRNALHELTRDGKLRATGLPPYSNNYANHPEPAKAMAYSLFAQGDPIKGTLLRYSDAKQILRGQSLAGFDPATNDPIWGDAEILAAPALAPDDPRTGRGYPYVSGWQLPATAACDIVVFDQSESSGWHLGGIKIGGNHFRWRASPSVTHDVPMDGLGSFDIGDGAVYKGNKVVTLGSNIVFGYNGEFWNQSQASQHMHFDDDGLFIGQFGTTGSIVSPSGPAVPGFAGNDCCPNIIRYGSDIYYYLNDESAHGGIHRWHLLGADAANKLTGDVQAPGGSVVLQASASPVPREVRAVASNGSAQVNWQPAAAVSYRVKWSTHKGGPYPNIVPDLTGTTCQVSNLANDTPHYFIVTSLDSVGNESLPSEEAHMQPIDVNIPVHLLGQVAVQDHTEQHLPATPHNVVILPYTPLNFRDSGDPNKGRFAVQLHPMFDALGTLHAIDFGSQGYNLFNFDGSGKSFARLMTGYAVSQPVNCGFISTAPDQEGLSCTLRPYGQPALLRGSLAAKPDGRPYSVRIDVPDKAAWHCLTAVSPVLFADLRHYTMRLSSRDDPAQHCDFILDESNQYSQGYTHLVQFAFRGDVELTMLEAPESTAQKTDARGNRLYARTYLSAIFLDDYPAR